MNIYEKLSEIQHELKAPKGQYNSFGKYKYRSCEDILEAVKPLCYKYKATLVLSDEVVCSNDRYYIKATATLYDNETMYATEEQMDANSLEKINLLKDRVQNTAFARESQEKKGMDESQITGTASSYARKYALNGLFNIDDTKDADTDEYKVQTDGNVKIDKTKVMALQKAIENANIPDSKVQDILQNFGYKKIEDIQVVDYMKVVNTFKEAK